MESITADELRRIRDKKISLKKISGILSIVAFMTNLIAIASFSCDVFFKKISLTWELAISMFLIFFIIYGFSMFLFNYSRGEYEQLNGLIMVFSWLYILLSALLFLGISYRFIVEANYSLYEYISYIFLIFFIAGLGYCISYDIMEKKFYFSIPFMLVGLFQAIIWAKEIFNRQIDEFSWILVGNLMLLVLVSLLIVFFKK